MTCCSPDARPWTMIHARLAAEAAGQPFITYNEAVALVAAEVREHGSLDQVDVDRLFARMSPP